MARKYTKVLALMQEKGGRIEVNDPDLTALLGRLIYKLAGYMSGIRNRAKLEVRAIRNGRKVTAYELVAQTATPDAATNADVTPAV
jgi:hypothetical protein